jgi:dienelactone hydrolase
MRLLFHSYLVNVSEEILQRSTDNLPDIKNWEAWRKSKQERYLKLLGLDTYLQAPRTPLNTVVTEIHQRQGYIIKNLHYQSLPGLYVAGNLYIPDTPGKKPAILYLCGHSDIQKFKYQQHARRYAQLGFVSLVIDTVQLGEVGGYHHGPYRYGWFNWYSMGYTPAAIEVWNGIRGIDLLCEMPEVDESKIGTTGISGGGFISWQLAQADDRVSAVSPSCGTSTILSYIKDQTIDANCDCAYPNNSDGLSLVEWAALIAPRPVFITSAERDYYFTIDSINQFYQKLSQIYTHLGAEDKLSIYTFYGPHSYTPESRRRTFQWFIKQLQGKDEEVDDLDDYMEDHSTLSVFKGIPPIEDRASNVHNWLIPTPAPPKINSVKDLEIVREKVVKELKDLSFHTFPDPLPDPDTTITMEAMPNISSLNRKFTFASEPTWRGSAMLRIPQEVSNPTPIIIEVPGQKRDRHNLFYGTPERWLKGTIWTRGTDRAAWDEQWQWHLRRSAALTGRTIASLRVLDLLQGIKAFRQFSEVDQECIYLAASGEMTVPTIYAALLDGNIKGVILQNAITTHNQPTPNQGPCLEILNVLRIVDLPIAAGLLWPTHLIFLAGMPNEYFWTEMTYMNLGLPGRCVNVPTLNFWNFNL